MWEKCKGQKRRGKVRIFSGFLSLFASESERSLGSSPVRNGRSRWNQVHQPPMAIRAWHGGKFHPWHLQGEEILPLKLTGVDNTKLDKIMERFGIWHLLRELQQIQLSLRRLDKQQMSKKFPCWKCFQGTTFSVFSLSSWIMS